MTGGIQTSITTQPAVGVVGDFSSANPRFSTLAGPGAVVAGPSGLVIGRFAWLSYSQVDGDGAPAAANNFGTGPVAGFVGRAQQGLITTYLSAYGMTIPAGFQSTLFSGGDFWALNNGASAAQVGMKAYASFVDGSVTFAAAGAPTTASATTSAIAAGTAATGTGTVQGNVLTIASVTNTIFVGAVVTGTGVATGSTIVSQISGTPGGAGTYAVDIPSQSVASTALTLTPYVLDTTGGTVTGTIVIGGVISSAGTPTGVVVGKSVASAYAAGKWVIATKGATSASGTVVIASNVETSWYAHSFGANGEIVKISNVPGIG
ncbi:hypothetical protein [Rhizobium rhizogenes]|uniref:gp53 minor capsid family protein n=1 Tax=Rhizobium rhizogenes TaxID=359 RepID=UPI00226DA417|nr:hypothetical protein [Rhizobium rhizogenes]